MTQLTKESWRIGSDCDGECSDPGSEFSRCFRVSATTPAKVVRLSDVKRDQHMKVVRSLLREMGVFPESKE